MSRGFLSGADLGLVLGSLPTGPKNAITDVEGVAVGHETVTDDSGSVQTGVTVIVPHPGNVFREKVIAACHVINGFGKTTGLVQIEELGQLGEVRMDQPAVVLEGDHHAHCVARDPTSLGGFGRLEVGGQLEAEATGGGGVGVGRGQRQRTHWAAATTSS